MSLPWCRLTTIDEGTPGPRRPLKCLFKIGGPRGRRHGHARACQGEPSEQRVDERRVSLRIFPLLLTVERPPRFLTVPPPLCGSHEVQVIVVVDELYTFLFHGGFHPWIGEGLELDLPLAIVWRLEPVDDVSRVAGDLAEF